MNKQNKPQQETAEQALARNNAQIDFLVRAISGRSLRPNGKTDWAHVGSAAEARVQLARAAFMLGAITEEVATDFGAE